MQAIDKITGVAIPLGLSNVDTDLIMPAPYLKTISRAGLGQFAFESLRAKPGNIFDQPRHQGAPILIAGDNFGCGSSREHAPWGLVDMGLRVIIAPSFADIFGGNAFKNGLLLVALDKAAVERLMTVAPAADISIDLQAQRVTTPMGDDFRFEIDPFRKHCLLQGLDEIGLTEKMADDIRAYEAMALRTRPWLGVRAVEKAT